MPGPLRGDPPFMHFSRGSVAVVAKGHEELENSGMRHGFSSLFSVMKWILPAYKFKVYLINSTLPKFKISNGPTCIIIRLVPE